MDRVFKDTLSTIVRLAATLKDVFENETVDSEPGESYHLFWEDVDITSPIPLRDFFDYILLPEMATLLIAQDLHVSKAEVYGIWARSKDYGNAFHGNVDDGTIDDINNENIKARVIFSCRPLLFKSFLNSHTSAPWDARWKRSTFTSSWKKGAVTPGDFFSDFTLLYVTALTRGLKPFQVRNATPGPGPQTAARIAAVEKPSPHQDGKTKKPTKSAKAPSKVAKAEVTWTFGSFATRAKDSYPKACTPVEPLWKGEGCDRSKVVVLPCRFVDVTVLKIANITVLTIFI